MPVVRGVLDCRPWAKKKIKPYGMRAFFSIHICRRSFAMLLGALFLSGTMQLLPEDSFTVSETGLGAGDHALSPVLPDDLVTGRGEDDDIRTDASEYAVSATASPADNHFRVTFVELLNLSSPYNSLPTVRNSRAPPLI